ncbi:MULTISPECIES: HNH endonuclease [Erythrobacter]|uniref:HNH endonuclease n=1 Tax=Erythrobacter aureus TaxID=2182384 RepID=A0A345YGK0_9SPHN|nr:MULTISPECIES: HNH endonuclease [Erythrobacter]AXK43052.1 HNH endonuclease [Erythrobacter aureus]MBL43262.1 HNH endonuclease [Sphingomonadaceae bacterium]MCF8881875.1 HNH endonuclease [Erythrobacter sp. SN021]
MSEPVDPACWLCERRLGRKVQHHHPVPKAKKGRVTVPVHPICHRAIHANFSNAELARIGEDRGALLAHPSIAKFVRWVADKPPDFHAPTRGPR